MNIRSSPPFANTRVGEDENIILIDLIRNRFHMVFKKFSEPGKDFPPRETVKGNWKCADCGKEITELPFEPSGDRPIYCRDCHAKRRPQRFGR